MLARRQLPHRLSFALLIFGAGCVSDRYVGSIGPDGVYSNRGYGFVVRLNPDDFDRRWRVIDPSNTKDVPPSKRPIVHDEPIDINGDNELTIGETTHYLVPALRFLSRTSTGAEITVDVDILGGKSKSYALDDLVIPQVRRLTRTASVVGPIERRTVAGYEARLAETPLSASGFAYRFALVDHQDFVAEQGVKRRQLYRIVLSAHEISDVMRKDLDLLLHNLLLSSRAGEQSNQERW